MTRAVPLSAVKAGITRLREKGGASPDALFDLVNGRVTAARTIVMRPGSEIDHQLPPGTKGLVYFRGKFVVFASEPVAPGNEGYQVEILKHPVTGSAATIDDIRFAAPFLGYLYVVARWSDGRIVHYWLQTAEIWQPNHVYKEGAIVSPTVPNGYAYKATRLNGPAKLWEPNVARVIGDRVEPTKSNGFEYTVVDVQGSNPRSGATEPAWATEDGALTYEDSDNTTSTTPGSTNDGNQVPPDVEDRYGDGNQNSGGAQ